MEEVIVGLAANAGFVSNVAFALVDAQRLPCSPSQIAATGSQTPYPPAVPHHRDLTNLTAQDIVGIADCIRHHGTFDEFTEKRVGELLADSIRQGALRTNDLDDRIVSHLARKGLI
ncbi:MAG: hypothetical protein ABR978_05920 [Dehalococcoidia bacterium]